MKLQNDTSIPAIIFRTIIDETRLAAAVIARITYRIINGRLEMEDEQPWIVSAEPWEGPEGPMPSDEVFYRGGTDILIFGNAYGKNGELCERTNVGVKFDNSLDYQLVVFGDRKWTKQFDTYVPTRPKPFKSMPLGLMNAYGGKAIWDEIEVASPVNPDGKGYCLEEEYIEQTWLPNIEDPNNLISNWHDTPDPVGVGICPMGFGPKLKKTVEFDKVGNMRKLHPAFFNSAFLPMIVPDALPGQSICIQGISPYGDIQFSLPANPLKVELQFGEKILRKPTYIDQVGIIGEQNQVFITYRYPFRYELKKRERRRCSLMFETPARIESEIRK